jgi:hypothetical protein
MSFQLLNPEDQILSKSPDSVAIEQIIRGDDMAGTSCYVAATTGSDSYIFLKTSKYFPLWSFSQTDRIKLGGLVFVDASSTTQAAGNALISWLQRDEGHVVVGIAHSLVATPLTAIDGANSDGYANFIIIRNRIVTDTTTGVSGLDRFTTNDDAFFADFRAYPVGYEGAGALNLSRQVQLVLRVITREYDPTTNVRPDNV